MKSDHFLPGVSVDVRAEEDVGVVLSDISWCALVEQDHNHIQSRDVISPPDEIVIIYTPRKPSCILEQSQLNNRYKVTSE